MGGGIGGGGFGNPQPSAKKNPVSWAASVSQQKVNVGDTISVVLIGTIEEDWYIYSNDFDPSLGPNLAEVTFIPSGYKLLGKAKPVGAESHFEKIWDGTVSTFKKKAEFVQKIIITSTKVNIKGSVLYQACSTVNGTCLPPNEYEFEIDLTAGPKPGQSSTPQDPAPVATPSNPSTSSNNQSVEDLEKEKQKYTPRDNKGNDVSRSYLQNFILRRGK